jgi:hypothetical protein
MRIPIEGLSDVDNDLKDLIIDFWKSKKLRKFFRFNLDLLFSSQSAFSRCIDNRRRSVIVL